MRGPGRAGRVGSGSRARTRCPRRTSGSRYCSVSAANDSTSQGAAAPVPAVRGRVPHTSARRFESSAAGAEAVGDEVVVGDHHEGAGRREFHHAEPEEQVALQVERCAQQVGQGGARGLFGVGLGADVQVEGPPVPQCAGVSRSPPPSSAKVTRSTPLRRARAGNADSMTAASSSPATSHMVSAWFSVSGDTFSASHSPLCADDALNERTRIETLREQVRESRKSRGCADHLHFLGSESAVQDSWGPADGALWVCGVPPAGRVYAVVRGAPGQPGRTRGVRGDAARGRVAQHQVRPQPESGRRAEAFAQFDGEQGVEADLLELLVGVEGLVEEWPRTTATFSRTWSRTSCCAWSSGRAEILSGRGSPGRRRRAVPWPG